MALTPQELKDLREAVPTWMRSGKGLAGDVDLSTNTLKSFNPPEGRIKRRGEDEEGEKVPYINRSPAGGNPPPPPPPCRGPSLLCDSSSNSKSKCGFFQFTTPSPINHCYLHQTWTADNSYDYPDCPATITGSGAWDVDPVTCDITGSSSSTYTDCSITQPQPGCGIYGDTYCGIPDTTGGAATITQTVADYTKNSAPDHEHNTWTLSDEYTTDQLKTDTIDGIPAYPGTYGGTCSAYRNLSDDESSFSVRKFRYKFAFRVPSTNCFKMSWIERFTPEGGGGATDTAKSYTYDGSGMPGDHLETDVHDYGVPTADGTTTIEQIWWTCQCDTDPTGEGTP